MASAEDIEQAYACLSIVFPEFVAKEMAAATDQIVATIQGFSDPLAAIGDLNVDSLVDDVATLEGHGAIPGAGRAAVPPHAQRLLLVSGSRFHSFRFQARERPRDGAGERSVPGASTRPGACPGRAIRNR